MNEAIFIAASGANKQIRKLEVISNNLANVSSSGFKKDQLAFEALIPPFGEDTSFEASRNTLLSPNISNADVSYVGISQYVTDFVEGPLIKTDNPLDLAINGDGFFEIETPAGIRYTRKGNFRLDGENRLINHEGHLVLADNGGPLVIDAFGKPIAIDNDGLVSIVDGLATFPVGNIKVTDFDDLSKLVKEGDGVFRMTDPEDKGKISAQFKIHQGFYENSNVSVMEELNKMILTLRGFEAYQKIIQTIDRIDNQSINTLGRIV